MNTPCRVVRALVPAAMFATLWCAGVPAEPYQTVLANGDPQNRVDIAILGDGYTAAQMAQYQGDVQAFLQYFFLQEPFQEYQRYFNVHRIDVASNQSGADHPENGTYVDTALDASYDCGGVLRLICVNTTKVNTIVANTLAPAQHDLVIVAVNDPAYGGSGGAVVVTYNGDSAIDTVLHELGHTLGLLGDEYGGPPPPACDSSVEPAEVNVTKQTQRSLIKWATWIDAGTPVPTTTTTPGVPGLYQGARYCDAGLYRPTWLSKMRDVDYPFEQVNTEQLVKRVYGLVSPLDASLPAASTVTLDPARSLGFSATPVAPLTHSLNVAWSVDGQARGTGTAFVLSGSGLSPGPHSVAVLVSDPTGMVRSDPAQVLRAQRTWTVNVAPDADGDGIADSADNCTLVANPSQLDANGDGYGNACDADLDNNGSITATDFALLRSVLGRASGYSALAAAADLDGNGTVTATDFAILRKTLGGRPGPSGQHPNCPPTCP